MKLKWLRFIVQSMLIGVYFFPITHQKENTSLKFNVFQAILYGDYMIFGNVVIGLSLLGVIIHLLSIVIEMINNEDMQPVGSITNIIVNLTVIFGFVIVTFLGTFLEWFGYGLIGLLILSTYLRYLDQKSDNK